MRTQVYITSRHDLTFIFLEPFGHTGQYAIEIVSRLMWVWLAVKQRVKFGLTHCMYCTWGSMLDSRMEKKWPQLRLKFKINNDHMLIKGAIRQTVWFA